jgi:hypothetical protein
MQYTSTFGRRNYNRHANTNWDKHKYLKHLFTEAQKKVRSYTDVEF